MPKPLDPIIRDARGGNPGELLKVEGGLISPAAEPKEAPIVDVSQFEEIAVSVIQYFDNPAYPNAPITSLVTTTVTEVGTGVGATQYLTRVAWQATPQVAWYTKVGPLAKILAENVNGNYARKVSLIVKYDDKLKVMIIAFDVSSFELRIGEAEPGQDASKLNKEDLQVLR